MATICEGTARGDWLLHRGNDEPMGATWRVDNLDGRGYAGKDLSDWSGTLTLSDDWGGELHRQECGTLPDGKAVCLLSASAIDAIDVTSGTWRIDLEGPEGQRKLLGWGHFRIC